MVKMLPRRVAIIGHSASGKSSCLKELKIDRGLADMDCRFGTSDIPLLQKVLDYLVSVDTPPIVAVSNHRDLLAKLCCAKHSQSYRDTFQSIHFVYLKKAKEKLSEHLRLRDTDGRQRCEDNINSTIKYYDEFDNIFIKLADRWIDCTEMPIDRVAERIRQLHGEMSTM